MEKPEKLIIIKDIWNWEKELTYYMIGVKRPLEQHGFLFWTGPEENTYSEYLVDAWATPTIEKAQAQASLLEAMQMQ
jgi:hypothetical protein